jgi:hypothetical protein
MAGNVNDELYFQELSDASAECKIICSDNTEFSSSKWVGVDLSYPAANVVLDCDDQNWDRVVLQALTTLDFSS